MERLSADLLDLGARKGGAGQIVARIVGHTKVDTTLNVYTQVIEDSATG